MMQKRLKQAIFAGAVTAALENKELTPIEKLQALQAQMPQAGYIRQAGLLRVLPISPATLWRWTANAEFPKPVKLSKGVTAWRIDEIREWIRSNG